MCYLLGSTSIANDKGDLKVKVMLVSHVSFKCQHADCSLLWFEEINDKTAR